MRKARVLKQLNKSNLEAEVQERLDYVTDLASRYQMHLKQRDFVMNFKQDQAGCFELLRQASKSLQTMWNRFCSVAVRGPYSQKEIFIELCKTHKANLTQSQQQNLQIFTSILSEEAEVEDDLSLHRQVICIFFTRENVQEISAFLRGEFIGELIRNAGQSLWKISVKFVDPAIKNELWYDKIKEFYADNNGKEKGELNKLAEITVNSLNTTQRLLKSKESGRIFLHSQIESQSESFPQKMQFPIAAPLWRGLLDQIIMFRPKNVYKSHLNQINSIFLQREELQSEVKAIVQLNLAQQKRKQNEASNECDMNSIHKIEISQYKDQL